MKRSVKTDMSVSWLRVLRLLDAGDKVKRETEAAVAAVEADRDRSREWKDKMIKRLRDEEGAESQQKLRRLMPLVCAHPPVNKLPAQSETP